MSLEENTKKEEAPKEETITKKIAALEVYKWLYSLKQMALLSIVAYFSICLAALLNNYAAVGVTLLACVVSGVYVFKSNKESKRLEVTYNITPKKVGI